MKSHNLRRLHEAGLRVTINSDDPPYFGGYIGKNISAAQDALALSDDDAFQMVENGFRCAFLSDGEIERFVRELHATGDAPDVTNATGQ